MNLLPNLTTNPVVHHTRLDIDSIGYHRQNEENYAEMDAQTMAEVVSDKLIEVFRKELEKVKIVFEKANEKPTPTPQKISQTY